MTDLSIMYGGDDYVWHFCTCIGLIGQPETIIILTHLWNKHDKLLVMQSRRSQSNDEENSNPLSSSD